MDNYTLKLFIDKIRKYEPELVSYIYDLTKNDIKINNYYIIVKEMDGNVKKQYAKIDGFVYGADNKKYYTYYYGNFGFHEGCCSYDEVMELNDAEKILSESDKFWELPQQFYQSFPE